MHGQANGTVGVMLHHFGSFVHAVSPQQQPNWCLTAATLTANKQQPMQTVHRNPKVEVFIWHFCIISMICLQGNRIKKGWKICREYVNRLELYFFSLPHYYLIVHLYWMLLYDILLYKHVFENVLMYALCLYHAVCYLAFCSIRLPPIWFVPFLLPRIMLFTLVPFFFYHPAPVFQPSHPNRDMMMHRQSEKYI